jgi:Ca2+-binding EF-hand superfamily protein
VKRLKKLFDLYDLEKPGHVGPDGLTHLLEQLEFKFSSESITHLVGPLFPSSAVSL